MMMMVYIDDVEFYEYVVILFLDLFFGYYDVVLSVDDDEFVCFCLIVVLEVCYMLNEIKEGKKIWGLSV